MSKRSDVLSSIKTLCGGRNDLTFFSQSDTQKSDVTSRSDQQTQTSQAREEDSQVVSIDYDKLAVDLLAQNDSSMCTQSYIVGSGAAKQTVMVNRACRCVIFDQIFTSQEPLKVIGRFLRPLIYGKIYYHPKNGAYARLIKQINETFESLDELVKLFRLVRRGLVPVLNTTRDICNQTSNAPAFCAQLGTAKTSFSLFVILTEFIACSERDRFVPANSEAEMMEEGKVKAATDGFLAGIKFLDDISDSDNLPKHMRFKIRMALDFVDSTFRTEDR